MTRNSRNLVLLLISLAITVALIYLNKQLQSFQDEHVQVIPNVRNYSVKSVRYDELRKYLNKEELPVNKTILFWTNFFSSPFWTLGANAFREGYLKSIKCPVTNCMFTTNRSHLRHPHEYDAIVFHAAQREDYMSDLPATRHPRQVYIVATKECPSQLVHNLQNEQSFYNLTLTYRLDSDIPWTYGTTIDLSTGLEIAPALNVQWRQPDHFFNDSSLLKIAKSKTGVAAWFVSHCNAFSERDELVKDLQKYVEVDVYGKCGQLKCERSSTKCNEMLNSTYRFYLALENTLCTDYVTEKVYDSMQNFVIPVIYSGANLSKFLPPHSYIDVESFESVAELASYLQFLSSNPHEYIKFFWWRKYYKIASKHQLDLCKICKKLNEPKFQSKAQVYASIKDWFYTDACRSPRIKLL